MKLTKAQRYFMVQLAGLGVGFSTDIMTGPESAMAGRLIAAGYVRKQFEARHKDWFYQLTDLGRSILAENTNG